MKYVLEFTGKGTGYANGVKLKVFKNVNEANKFIKEHTDLESKYWTDFKFVEVDQVKEIAYVN